MDEYQTYAASVAQRYGLDVPTFFGLIQTESSWNPNARASTSSAVGFTQLLRGTAKDLGVDPNDWRQNLTGGAKYLSSLLSRFGGSYTDALAAYHDGAGAVGQHGGYSYAATVHDNAQAYATAAKGWASTIEGAAFRAMQPGAVALGKALQAPGQALTGAVDSATGAVTGVVSGYINRIAILVLAFLFIAVGLYALTPKAITSTAAKLAA